MEITVGEFHKTFATVTSFTDFYKVTPFIWNFYVEEIKVKSQTRRRILFILFILYMSLYSGISLTQTIIKWNEIDVVTRTYGLTLISGSLAVSFPTFSAFVNAQQIADLFNTMVTFERRRRRALINEPMLANSLAGKLLKLSSLFVSLGPHIFSTFMFVNIFVSPCFTAYPFYYLSPQCTHYIGFLDNNIWTQEEIFIRLLLSTGGAFCVIIGASVCLEFSCFAMMKGCCLRSYIRSYATILSKQKYILHHRSTYIIREIHLMVLIFREIYSNFALLFLAAGVMLCQTLVMFLAVAISQNSKTFRPEFEIVFGSVGGVFFVVILCLYGNLGWILTESARAQRNILRCSKSMKNRWFRKFYRSCPVLKINLGSCCYIEPFTALTMEENVLKNVVNLLLLDKN